MAGFRVKSVFDKVGDAGKGFGVSTYPKEELYSEQTYEIGKALLGVGDML